MEFTSEMVDDYANKLLIGLTKEENQMVLEEFDIINNNMNVISSLPNITNIEPMTHTLDDFEYVLRNDEYEEGISINELLRNCDVHSENEIIVPKVVNNE